MDGGEGRGGCVIFGLLCSGGVEGSCQSTLLLFHCYSFLHSSPDILFLTLLIPHSSYSSHSLTPLTIPLIVFFFLSLILITLHCSPCSYFYWSLSLFYLTNASYSSHFNLMLLLPHSHSFSSPLAPVTPFPLFSLLSLLLLHRLIEAEYKQLVGNLEEVVVAHSNLLTALEEQSERPSREQRIGGAFLTLAPHLQSVHQIYCGNHPRAVCMLEKYK